MHNWKIYLALGLLVTTAIVVGCVVWFSIAGWWPIVLDVVLSFAALASLGLLAALTIVAYYTLRVVMEIKNDVMPVLDSLKATSNTVRATASTASSFGVKPAVRTASLAVGAAEVASVILGRGHARSRAEKRQKRRQQIERELAQRETTERELGERYVAEHPALREPVVEQPVVERTIIERPVRRGELNGTIQE